jgi:hypothetical protein
VNAVARVALTIATLFALFAPSLAAPGHIVETEFQDRLVAASSEEETSGTTDLYGNEITSAVATYELDETGSLYEVHSPQTQLLSLAAPEG